MANQNKQYICGNPGCENFYDSYEIIINNNEAIPGTESETCCPKCSMPLTDYEAYLNDEKEERKRKRKKMLLMGLTGVLVVGIALVVYFVLIPMLSQKNTDIAEDLKVEINIEPKTEIVQESEPSQESESAQESKPLPINGANTKIFGDGSKYVGILKSGKMNGMGTYYYATRQLISNKDLKKIC